MRLYLYQQLSRMAAIGRRDLYHGVHGSIARYSLPSDAPAGPEQAEQFGHARLQQILGVLHGCSISQQEHRNKQTCVD
jgi:hypothetical protein